MRISRRKISRAFCIVSAICSIAFAVLSYHYHRKLQQADFYDLFTEGKYEEISNTCLEFSIFFGAVFFVSCIIMIIGSFQNKRNKVVQADCQLDRQVGGSAISSEVEEESKDQEANNQDVSMKYMEYLAIRRVLDKDFCGDDDVVFHHLCDDTVTIITTYSPPEKRFKRVCEVATSLYYDENKDHKTAVDVSKAPVFADWLILFLKSFGYSEEQLPKKQNIRKSNYSPRKLIESTPMYYLDADSWDDFKDAEKLRHYLKQK